MHTIERITTSRVVYQGRKALRLLPLKVDGNFIWKTGRSTLTVTRDINGCFYPMNVNLKEVRLVLKHHKVIG